MFCHKGDASKIKLFFSFPLLVACAILICACQATSIKTETPSLVSDLLLEDSALPDGWVRIRDMPATSLSDPSINHVYRSWWGENQGYGKVEQAIWRSISEQKAKDFYNETRLSLLGNPIRTPVPGLVYMPYERSHEISFESDLANEYDYACGWSGKPLCIMVARYNNYTTTLIVEWQTTGLDGVLIKGMDAFEFSKQMSEVDKRFSEILK